MGLVWDRALAIGDPEIDADHRHLFGLLAQLEHAVGRADQRTILSDILSALADYTSYHFSREERVMAQLRYPGADDHIREHADLITRLAQLIFDFERGDVEVTTDTLKFLRGWLTTHTSGTDMKLGAFLKANCPTIATPLPRGTAPHTRPLAAAVTPGPFASLRGWR